MKSLMESIQDVNESRYLSNIHWTSNDKKNFEIIAGIFSEITGSLSDWMEEDEENEDSNTAAFAHTLSNLAAKLRGEWDDEISIKDVL